MKTSKHRRITPASSSAALEREARREIEHFKRALNSYADRFAREPHLSFEQHFFRLAANSRIEEATKTAQEAGESVGSDPGRSFARGGLTLLPTAFDANENAYGESQT